MKKWAHEDLRFDPLYVGLTSPRPCDPVLCHDSGFCGRKEDGARDGRDGREGWEGSSVCAFVLTHPVPYPLATVIILVP